MDEKTWWNLMLELYEKAYQLRKVIGDWLKNPTFSDYWPFFKTQDESTIVKHVMDIARQFKYLTLWTLKWHMVTLHPVITAYNNMFNHMDGIMRAFAKNQTDRKHDRDFIANYAWQMLSKIYAHVAPPIGTLLISVTSSILVGSCNHFWRWTREVTLIIKMRHSILPNTKRHFLPMWRMNTVLHKGICPSLNTKVYRATNSSHLQWL